MAAVSEEQDLLPFLLLCGAVRAHTEWHRRPTIERETAAQGHDLVRGAALRAGRVGATYIAFGAEDASDGAPFLNLACEVAGVEHRVRELWLDNTNEADILARFGPSLVGTRSARGRCRGSTTTRHARSSRTTRGRCATRWR